MTAGADFAADWTETPVRFNAAHGAAVLRQAIERHPGNVRLRTLLGEELRNDERHAEALEQFLAALAIDSRTAQGWAGAAACLRKLGRQADVLALCDGGWAGDESGRYYERGRALVRLGRIAEGREDLRHAARHEYPRIFALRALLESLSRSAEGAEMLALCDGLDPPQQALALVRGYRAAALSMLGRVDEARALVDLERCVLRYRFEPPAELGGLDQVNRRLADAILADAPAARLHDDVDINYRTHLRVDAEMRALRDFIRTSMRDYIVQTQALRAAAGMQSVPRTASLGFGTVVLRRKGHNGQHLHPIGYLSTVYHVLVPPMPDAQLHSGALVLGPCDKLAGGHRASWGERYIRAEAGWLTIFPSHVFHDVVPTQSPEPRVAVISDLNPNRGNLSARDARQLEAEEERD